MRNYNLQEAIMEYLENELEDIEDEVAKTTNQMSKEAVKELKVSSPRRVNGGNYAEGWVRTIINPWSKRKYSKYLSNRKYIVRIHNRGYYMLTHLLEFGHANRDGSRTKANPHIRPIEEKYNRKFETKLTTALRTRAYDNKGGGSGRKNRKKVMFSD